jgi:dihydrofolate reductase
MGSQTFRVTAPFWPTSTLPFATPMNQIPKAVFSKRGPAILAAATAGGVPGAASWTEAYVASGDLATEIAKLKAEDGKPIIAHGGAVFARSLVAHGLVDEYALLVSPMALGKGVPLFSDLAAPSPLKLISSRAFPGGAIAQVYRPS